MIERGFKKIWRFRLLLLEATPSKEDPRPIWGIKPDEPKGIPGTREVFGVTVIEAARYPAVMITAWRYKLGVYYIAE
jgi:hypothetical protein